MSYANFFTASRIVSAPLFIALYYAPSYSGMSKSLAVSLLIPLFGYMEFTDFLDGYCARKYKQVSDFGKLFDPFADVVANLTVLLTFMLAGYVPLPVFLIILYREMGILFLRMLARGNGITIAAKKGGKLKTVCYIIAEGLSLCIEMLTVIFAVDTGTTATLLLINKGLYYGAAALSILSFMDYVVSYRKNLKERKID